MYTLQYMDANSDQYVWVFRTQALAQEMMERIAQKHFHHWSDTVSGNDSPETFIATDEYADALADWRQFTSHEEHFDIEPAALVNCHRAVGGLRIP